MIKIVYTFDPIKIPNNAPSIFLAGPTPRSIDVASWRPEAISILESSNWGGEVYYPEYRIGTIPTDTYGEQIEWEHRGLDSCDAILVWVPRELKDMPSFTTNVEFGLYLKSDRLYYGRPDESPKNGYLDYCYKKFTGRNPCSYLTDLVEQTIGSVKGE